MAIKLTYGNETIVVDPKTDVGDLRGGIKQALQGDGWLSVPLTEAAEKWIYVVPGVPISISVFSSPMDRYTA